MVAVVVASRAQRNGAAADGAAVDPPALWEEQGLLFPQKVKPRPDAAIECHQRLGGLLRYDHRKAA